MLPLAAITVGGVIGLICLAFFIIFMFFIALCAGAGN